MVGEPGHPFGTAIELLSQVYRLPAVLRTGTYHVHRAGIA